MNRLQLNTIGMNGLLFFSLFFCMTLSINAQDAKSIIGQWKDRDNPGKQIEIYAQQQNLFFGKVIHDDLKKDVLVFKDLVYQENGNLYNGKLIDPDNGDEIAIIIKRIDNNQFQFKVKKFFISRTFHFVRIK